ncbi:hypothetical protein K402DRAFT_299860, partial [Aulographum hederae CBS 113979]
SSAKSSSSSSPSTSTAPSTPSSNGPNSRDWQSCGGLSLTEAGVVCPVSRICADAPRGPNWCGQACDEPGICVPPAVCGGDSGNTCASGMRCTNDPRKKC